MLDILCRVVLGYSISTKVYHLTLKTSPSLKLSNGRYLRLLVPPVVRADQEVSAAIAFSSHLQSQPLDQSRRLDHPYLPMADDSVQILSRCRSCSRQGKLGTYLVNQYILRWKKSHLRFHFRLKILASMIARYHSVGLFFLNFFFFYGFSSIVDGWTTYINIIEFLVLFSAFLFFSRI